MDKYTAGGIPKVIHKIWLGPKAVPAKYLALDETFRRYCPDWRIRWWGDQDIAHALKYFHPNNAKAFRRSANWGEKSDIARYELLYRLGGVYVDTDVQCLKPINPLVDRCDVSMFVGRECWNKNENKFIYGNAVIGSAPGHCAMKDVVKSLYWEIKRSYEENIGTIWKIVKGSGPHFLTKILDRHSDVTVFSNEVFYPGFDTETVRYYSGRLADLTKISPNSYLFHHWDNTWLESESQVNPYSQVQVIKGVALEPEFRPEIE